MKFLAIALLAVCLLQGHNAQPQFAFASNLASSFSNAARNAVSAASNAATNAASAVSNAATNAASAATNAVSAASNAAKNVAASAQNAAENALSTAQLNAQNAIANAQSAVSDLSANAQNTISAVTSGATDLSSIQSSLGKLNPAELLETIIGAETLVNNAVEKVQESLKSAINSASESAKASVEQATSSWNSDVAKAVNKAAGAGIDVSKCAATSVTDLGADAVGDAAGCVAKKISEGATIVSNILNAPKRAAEVTSAGVAAYKECSAKSGVREAVCHASETARAAAKALVVVKDTALEASKAAKFVGTVKEEVGICVAAVTASNALKAAGLAKDIVTCVKQTQETAASA